MQALQGDVLTAVMNRTSTSHDALVHMQSQTRGVSKAFKAAVDATRQNPALNADIRRRAELFRCAMGPDDDVGNVQVGYENYGIEELLRHPTYDALLVRMHEFFADETTQGRILSRLARDLSEPQVQNAAQKRIVKTRRTEVLRSGLLRCVAEAMRYYLQNRQIQESGLIVIKCVYSLQHTSSIPLTSMQLAAYVVNTIVVSMQLNLRNTAMLHNAARVFRNILQLFRSCDYDLPPPPKLVLDLYVSLMAPPAKYCKNLPNMIVAMMAQDTDDEAFNEACVFALFRCHSIIDEMGVLSAKLSGNALAAVPFEGLAAMPLLLRHFKRCITKFHVTQAALTLMEWIFTHHFESMRVDAPHLCRQIVQSLGNMMPSLTCDMWFHNTSIMFISKIMFRMQLLQPDPAQVLDFQNYVYDTGVVSVYLTCMLRERPHAHRAASAQYVSVVTRLCHNNPRIRALVQRLEIVAALDHFWAHTICDAPLQTNRTALNTMLQPPQPADGHGAPS